MSDAAGRQSRGRTTGSWRAAGTPDAGAAEAERHRFRRMIDISRDAYIEVDDSLTVTEWNQCATELLGWERGDIVGHHIFDIVGPRYTDLMEQSMVVVRDAMGPADDWQLPPLPSMEFEMELRHRDGRLLGVTGKVMASYTERGLRVGGFLHGTVPTPTSVREALPDGLHDPLTGLPTRALFTRRLAVAVRGLRHTGGSVAVVDLDLDRFKVINDTMGHDAGDDLLLSVVARLRLAAGDVAPLMARLGGDEFLAFFEVDDQGAREHAEQFARRAQVALEDPFSVGGREVYLTASVGIAGTNDPEMSAARLLSNTGGALHEAKAGGGGQTTVYEDEIRRDVVERMSTEHNLHRALERGELIMYYQPVVALGDQRPVAAEALIRWVHPEHGLVEPGRFIAVAEQTGMIIPIGAWALHEACRQMAGWRQQGASGSVEVNLSARQVDHPQLVATVERILDESGLPPGSVTLEITESTLMRDGPAALTVLQALKSLGVSLAIDDFGTGYSSLSYLRRFPLDILKIDRSFVEDLREGQAAEIVRAVIDLAHALDLTVVAEGVETHEQFALLRELGCDWAQGFLFSPPVPPEDLAARFAPRG